jgi:hypothetical protein
VHAVLQLADLETGADIEALARTFAAVEGVPSSPRPSLDPPRGGRRRSQCNARSPRQNWWRELFVAGADRGSGRRGLHRSPVPLKATTSWWSTTRPTTLAMMPQ